MHTQALAFFQCGEIGGLVDALGQVFCHLGMANDKVRVARVFA